MIRFILVQSRGGTKIVEEDEFKNNNYNMPSAYKGWKLEELTEGMKNLGAEYRYARVGPYSQEYYDVTEEQAVLVKLFMQ